MLRLAVVIWDGLNAPSLQTQRIVSFTWLHINCHVFLHSPCQYNASSVLRSYIQIVTSFPHPPCQCNASYVLHGYTQIVLSLTMQCIISFTQLHTNCHISPVTSPPTLCQFYTIACIHIFTFPPCIPYQCNRPPTHRTFYAVTHQLSHVPRPLSANATHHQFRRSHMYSYIFRQISI